MSTRLVFEAAVVGCMLALDVVAYFMPRDAIDERVVHSCVDGDTQRVASLFEIVMEIGQRSPEDKRYAEAFIRRVGKGDTKIESCAHNRYWIHERFSRDGTQVRLDDNNDLSDSYLDILSYIKKAYDIYETAQNAPHTTSNSSGYMPGIAFGVPGFGFGR